MSCNEAWGIGREAHGEESKPLPALCLLPYARFELEVDVKH